MRIKQCGRLFLFVLILCSFSITSLQAESFGKKLLNDIFKQPQDEQKADAAKTQQDQSSQQPSQPQQKQIIYSGYSKAFMPVKAKLAAGRAGEAAEMCNPKALQAQAAHAAADKTPVASANQVTKPKLGSEVLQQGSRGSKVVAVQECLNNKGYDAGSADGVYGKGTKGKVMEFQKANSIEPTGVVDQKTWDALYGQTAGSASATSDPSSAQSAAQLTSESLANLEGGNIALCTGNVDQAVEKFANAENLFARSKSGTKAGGWFNKGATFALETLLGNEEIGEYRGEGYEKVLMLNLKSIAYLLAGERKAYNVTRRAITWQETERRLFEDKIQEARKKYAAEKGKEQGSNKSLLSSLNLTEILAQDYKPMESKASTVPSAYVNPFGYYIAGMVQEFESFNEPSLRSNALISYKKALELNPDCRVLREIVNDIKNKPPQGKRLVHVVAGDGFVPEKKLLWFGLKLDKTVVPVKLPIYMPVHSQVSRIEVTSVKGKKLATLSTVADVEAICLRYQKDTQPLRDLRTFLAIMRTTVEKSVYDGAGEIGKVISDVRNTMTTPDMRSWMSLPATMQIARFYVPASADKIKITTFDKGGRKLASNTVELNTGSHNFVSVRSIDKTLYTQANKKMWFAKN